MMHKRYTKEQCTAAEAQRLAQEIAFGPVVFQVSRLMLKFGIFQLLSGKREGYTLQEISGRTGLTRYAAQVLLEASLTIGTILLEEDRYVLAKAGWFLLNDKMARVNMEFVSIRPRACFSPSYNKVKSQTKHVWLLTLL